MPSPFATITAGTAAAADHQVRRAAALLAERDYHAENVPAAYISRAAVLEMLSDNARALSTPSEELLRAYRPLTRGAATELIKWLHTLPAVS